VGKPKTLIVNKQEKLKVYMLHLCKSCISQLAGHRNKSNENHYPGDDATAQATLEYGIVMGAGSGLKSA
jgi:hypothetical protein